MVAGDLITRYETLRRQLDERLELLGPMAADDETDHLDAELVELEWQLPDDYHWPGDPA
jgi:hypothetical protein